MSDQPAPALPPKKPRSRTPIIIGAVAAVAVVAAVGIAIGAATSNTGGGAGSGGPSTGTGGSDAAASEWAGQTVNIGVADESQAYWDTYIDLVQDELGVTVELTNFEIDPGTSMLYGDVSANGESVVEDAYLFRLNGSTLEPLIDNNDGTVTLTGTRVFVSDAAAALLNETFGTDAVTDELLVGVSTITINAS